MAQSNYKKKKTNGGCITQKALPILAPAKGPLILLFFGRDGSFPVGKNLWMPEGMFFGGEGGGGVAPFSHLLYLNSGVFHSLLGYLT